MAEYSYREDSKPYQQWFWDDWFSEFSLRLCSLGARGLWIEMLGIMFKAEVRGTLTINRRPVSIEDLARIVGDTKENVEKYLKELEKNDVFSRLVDGTIICRRMYRESKIRQKKAEAGKLGAAKRWGVNSKGYDKNIANQDSKTMAGISGVEHSKSMAGQNSKIDSKSMAYIPIPIPITETNTKIEASNDSIYSNNIDNGINNYTPLFEDFWKEYPRKKEKKVAYTAWKQLKKSEQKAIIGAAKNYYIECKRLKREVQYIKHPATFIRKDRWKDYLELPPILTKKAEIFRPPEKETEADRKYREAKARAEEDIRKSLLKQLKENKISTSQAQRLLDQKIREWEKVNARRYFKSD